MMTHTDWEIYVSTRDATPVHRRVTRDIQHDLLPRFLSNTTLIGLMGEARHRRSQLYDLTTGTRTRLFSNNSIRTISPEYIWMPSADGQHLILQAERDGDTVSAERGLTVRRSDAEDLAGGSARAPGPAAGGGERPAQPHDRGLQAHRRNACARCWRRAPINRVYDYEKALFDFDSKHITQPGNLKAIEYLEKTYRSFGYDAGAAVVHAARASGQRRQDRQRRRHAQGHRESGAHLCREQPLRLRGRGPGRR